MKSSFYLILSFLLLISCNNKATKDGIVEVSKPELENTITSDYNLEVYNFNEFESFLQKKDNKTYVVNFWATWCAPCVKELPYFEKLNQLYKDKGVDVLLVSLDFPRQYEKKLIPFIQKKNLQSKIIALNDTKMNDWIPKVDEDWTGAIPATVIYNSKQRRFFEKSFTYKELEDELNKILNNK